MRCARCANPIDLEDSFCRRCGAAVNRRDLPTVVSRSLLPVPWDLARGPLVRGILALAVGTAVELVRREVVRRATAPEPREALTLLAGEKPVPMRRGRFPWTRVPRGEYEVTETVVQRRVRFLRG